MAERFFGLVGIRHGLPLIVLAYQVMGKENCLHILKSDRRIIIPEWNEDLRNKQGLIVCED